MGWRIVMWATLFVGINIAHQSAAQIVVSGNENKIGLTSGAPRLVDNAGPDSITILNFQSFPPRVRHVSGISNTVIGPPSNLAVVPGDRYLVLADSLRIDRTETPDPWTPGDAVHLIDLQAEPPAIVDTATSGLQPSGLSIAPDGRTVLVANRAEGSITVLEIDGDRLHAKSTLPVCDSSLSLSDVAIDAQGKRVLASVQKGGYLQVLELSGDQLSMTEHQVSVYGQPYRVVISPDGAYGLTAGQGSALNGIDADCLSIVDLRHDPPRAIDHLAIGAVPESIEVSPDGQWVAAVLMAGSNFPKSDARHSDHGELVLVRRRGSKFTVVQRHAIGRIPEGVAFTRDGKYLLVQCHPDREIRVFRMTDGGATDTEHRITVPGMPSSLRAG